jgi:hypothetical protein
MDLLLAHADDHAPILRARPHATSMRTQVQPVAMSPPEHLADITGNANDLARQRWALVVPSGNAGERMVALVWRLVEQRADDQRNPALIIRVPPGMNEEAAMVWKKATYPALYGNSETLRPRYLLILGDLDQVSLATQQALAGDGIPGRLVCRTDEGYEAYVDKVLGWQRRTSTHRQARALFYTVHDGTAATASAYGALVRPCFEQCARERREYYPDFPARSVEEHGGSHPDPCELLALVTHRHPSLLFSVSHGMGPPRRRRWSPSEARELQGAMCFGAGNTLLPSDIARCAFLPGGLWFYIACFGAGTPSTSAYHHWLAMLDAHGMPGLGPLQSVLAGLSENGGFTSGLAQAALANPDGPLAMVGHIDLAWSYGYEVLQPSGRARWRTISRAPSYAKLLTRLIQGERLGAAHLQLQQEIDAVGREINTHYDQCKRRGVALEGESEADRVALCHLWLLRQDLLGYTILGDPAVRLPLAAENTMAGSDIRARFQAAIGGGAATYTKYDGSDHIPGDRLDRIEQAIVALTMGARSRAEVAAECGVSPGDAHRWEWAYREAGRRALARLLAGERI